MDEVEVEVVQLEGGQGAAAGGGNGFWSRCSSGDSTNSNSPVLACNNDAADCGPASRMSFPVTAGSQWYIRVGTPANSAAQAGAGTLSIACTPNCVADIDGDGNVGGSDLAALLGAWGSSSTTADLDGDGTVNGADLASLLGAWGPC